MAKKTVQQPFYHVFYFSPLAIPQLSLANFPEPESLAIRGANGFLHVGFASPALDFLRKPASPAPACSPCRAPLFLPIPRCFFSAPTCSSLHDADPFEVLIIVSRHHVAHSIRRGYDVREPAVGSNSSSRRCLGCKVKGYLGCSVEFFLPMLPQLHQPPCLACIPVRSK